MERYERALVGGELLRPERLDGGKVVVRARAALAKVNPERFELIPRPADANTKYGTGPRPARLSPSLAQANPFSGEREIDGVDDAAIRPHIDH
jgi:hypothetical protein